MKKTTRYAVVVGNRVIGKCDTKKKAEDLVEALLKDAEEQTI